MGLFDAVIIDRPHPSQSIVVTMAVFQFAVCVCCLTTVLSTVLYTYPYY